MEFNIKEQLPIIRSGCGVADARVSYDSTRRLICKSQQEAQMIILLRDFRDAKPVAKDKDGIIYFEVNDGTIVASKFNKRVDVYKINNSRFPYFHDINIECLRLADREQITRFEKDEIRPGETIEGFAGLYIV